MKTIEEKAKEYAAKCHCQNTEWGFIAGAQSEHEELTRWRDPNVELPPNGWEVLCDIDCCSNNYAVLRHYDNGWMMYTPGSGWCDCPFKVIGWRGINE